MIKSGEYSSPIKAVRHLYVRTAVTLEVDVHIEYDIFGQLILAIIKTSIPLPNLLSIVMIQKKKGQRAVLR